MLLFKKDYTLYKTLREALHVKPIVMGDRFDNGLLGPFLSRLDPVYGGS